MSRILLSSRKLLAARCLVLARWRTPRWRAPASGTCPTTATVNTNCTVNSPTLTFAAIDSDRRRNSRVDSDHLASPRPRRHGHQVAGPGAHQIAVVRASCRTAACSSPMPGTAAANTHPWAIAPPRHRQQTVYRFQRLSAGVATRRPFTVYGTILAPPEDVPANTYRTVWHHSGFLIPAGPCPGRREREGDVSDTPRERRTSWPGNRVR